MLKVEGIDWIYLSEDISKAFAANLKTRMSETGIGIDTVSEKTEIPVKLLGEIAEGSREPKTGDAAKIAAALDTTALDLYNFDLYGLLPTDTAAETLLFLKLALLDATTGDSDKGIGGRLKLIRTKKSVSVDELAKRTGFDEKTLNDWESAKDSPTLSEMVKLSVALDVPLFVLTVGVLFDASRLK